MEHGDHLILEAHVESRALFAIMLFAFFAILGITLGVLPSSDTEAPRTVFTVFTAAVAFFAWNYRRITITLTDRRLRVGYGVFASERRLQDIASVGKFTRPWWSGYGTRLTLLEGKMGWMHNAIGKPLVIVRMHEGKGAPFAFSCDDPDRIITAITEAQGSLLDTSH